MHCGAGRTGRGAGEGRGARVEGRGWGGKVRGRMGVGGGGENDKGERGMAKEERD